MPADGLHPLAAATQTYLDAHFCDASVLAESAGIPETTLEGLVAAGMVPQPAYVVAGDTLVSAAFGPLDCNGLRPGQYHRKAAAPWAVRAAAFGGDAARAFELELRAERREQCAGRGIGETALWRVALEADDPARAGGARLEPQRG